MATTNISGNSELVTEPPENRNFTLSVAPPDLAAKKRSRQKHLIERVKALGPSLIAMIAALAAIFVMIHLPGPLYQDPGMLSFLLVLGISFPLVLLLTLAIHEFGHLLGAALAGLEFRLVTVGPLRLARELRGTRLTFVRRNLLQWQGNAFCIPRHERQLRARLVLFLLGGPVATLGQTAVTLYFRAQLADAILPYWLAQVSFLLAYCPLAILPFTLFPMRFRGITTDAAQLVTLVGKKENFPPRAAINLLVAASIRGSRPREWDQRQLDLLIRLPAEMEEAHVGHYLAHLKALDQGEPLLAGHHLDLALRPFRDQPGHFPPPVYLWAAAAFDARFGRGTAVAQEWLDLVRPESYNALAVESEQILWQTKAIVFYKADDLVQARQAAARSLALLPRIIEKGQAVVAEELLGGILAAATAVAPATTPDEEKPLTAVYPLHQITRLADESTSKP